MNKAKKLSIIIPMYNAELYISKCIESLLKQNVSREFLEIIIVDDGSSDNSVSIANNYVESFNNITLHCQNNLGASMARNKGIQLSSGEFLYFVDSDDYISENVLKTLMYYLTDEIDVLAFDSIHTRKINLNQARNFETKKNIQIKYDGLEFLEKQGYRDAVGWFFIRKQWLIESVNYYPNKCFLEDVSFNLEMLTTAKSILYVPIDVYRYVYREESVMTKRSSKHDLIMMESYERIIFEFEEKIEGLRSVKPIAVERLIWKQRVYHFFLFIRIMRSNMELAEINDRLKKYKNNRLYPLKNYSSSKKTQMMIFIFNHRILFLIFTKLYRTFY